MTKKRIFTVGFELPGAEFEYIEFGSDQTLLDADIILFEPSLGEFDFEYGAQYAGKNILSHYSSSIVKERLKHWHSEIIYGIIPFTQVSRARRSACLMMSFRANCIGWVPETPNARCSKCNCC